MPSSRRSHKRKQGRKEETTIRPQFYFAIIGIIILCVGIIGIKNFQAAEQMRKQREWLEKELASIFEEEPEKTEPQETPKTDVVVNIAVVGDILCGNAMLENGKKADGTYDFSEMFAQATPYLKKADIAVGTMETNFINEAYSGYKTYNSPLEFGQAVKESGIDLVSIAHNHSLDYGIQGLEDTKTALEKMGYQMVGTKGEQKNYTVQEVKGIKIAFLAYTYGFSNEEELSTQEKQYVNIYQPEIAKQDIEQAKQEADYIMVIMHWGDVNSTKRSKEQEEIADFLVANGANSIVGAHPAVVEPMQIKKNAEGESQFVSYSVGNYISSLGYDKANIEMILNIQIRKKAEEEKVYLEKVTYTPMYVWDKGEKQENRFVLLDMKEAAKKYADGTDTSIGKKVYDQLVKGLNQLEEIIRSTEE